VLLLSSAVASAGPAGPAGSVDAALTGPVAFATVTVQTLGDTLNERSGPSTYYAIHGQFGNGARVGVVCQAWGEQLSGTTSTSAWWELDTRGWYISDAFVSWSPSRPAMPWCGSRSHRAVWPTVQVADGATLSIRTGPGTAEAQTAVLPDGGRIDVACRAWGESIDGRVSDTPVWDRLTGGGFVSDAFVSWSPGPPMVPWCGEAPQSVPQSRAAFIADSIAPARASMARYGVPASVTIAQAILESGAGASALTRVDHSVFGMKCFGSPGDVAVGCRSYGTYECEPSCFRTSASFRAYRTIDDSFLDHGLMLATLPWYQPAFKYTHNPDKFAQALQNGGYATDPHYARSLINLMRQYDLYRYDH